MAWPMPRKRPTGVQRLTVVPAGTLAKPVGMPEVFHAPCPQRWMSAIRCHPIDVCSIGVGPPAASGRKFGACVMPGEG